MNLLKRHSAPVPRKCPHRARMPQAHTPTQHRGNPGGRWSERWARLGDSAAGSAWNNAHPSVGSRLRTQAPGVSFLWHRCLFVKVTSRTFK